MTRTQLVLAFVLSVLALGSETASAQFAIVEPYSVRSSAMGFSGSADVYDPANVFYNPAALAVFDGVQAGFNHSNPLAYLSDDMSFVSIGVGGSHRYETGGDLDISVGLDLRVADFDFGEVLVTDLDGNVISVETPSERAYGISAAIGVHLDDAFYVAIGGAIKPLDIKRSLLGASEPEFEPQLPDGDGTAFDLGIVIGGRSGDVWTVAPSVGLSLVNRGDAIDLQPQTSGTITIEKRVELPASFRLGTSIRIEGPVSRKVSDALGVEVPEMSFSVNGEFQNPEGVAEAIVGGGVEVGLYQMAFLRAGFRDVELADSKVMWGFGLGLPYRAFRLRFDYARYTPFEVRDTVNRFGGAVAFMF